MVRALVYVPARSGWLVGQTPIGPGYPRPYAPADMRGRAVDAERLRQVLDEDQRTPAQPGRLASLLAASRADLSPDARGVVDAHRRLMLDPADGIKGSLRPDGRVELAGGRHRAHYLEEIGAPVPVWVIAPDSQSLARFRAACEARLARDEANARGARDRGLTPTRSLTPERDR